MRPQTEMLAGILAIGAATIAILLSAGHAEAELQHAASMRPDVLSCDTDAECAALPPCALKPGCDGGPTSRPYALVGYGCAGADRPLYRDEEDEFPAPCARIESTFLTIALESAQ